MSERVENIDGAYHRSPSLGIVAVVFVVLSVLAIVISLIMTSGAYPNPYSPVEQSQWYFSHFPGTVRLAAFLLFGSSVPLGIFTATVVSRLWFHRIKVAGVYIALFGGFAASIFMGITGLSLWALSQPGVAADAGATQVLLLVSFAGGGFCHVVTLGLLLAGVSVPCLFVPLMPRWLAWAGLVIAAVCVLSVFSMLVPAASVLLPLGRFPAFLWLVAAGFSIPKTRMAAA